jgi:hypothetical protein
MPQWHCRTWARAWSSPVPAARIWAQEPGPAARPVGPDRRPHRQRAANLATIRAAVIAALKDAGYLHIPEGRRDHTAPAETLRLPGLD